MDASDVAKMRKLEKENSELKKMFTEMSMENRALKMQNAYIERKNGSIRRELLNVYLFYSLTEVRTMTKEWRTGYNTERPHKSLGICPRFNNLLRKDRIILGTQ